MPEREPEDCVAKIDAEHPGNGLRMGVSGSHSDISEAADK
jgi:hypothetical protein